MFYLHKVESKNSLYSVAATYETSIEKLIENNPELSEGMKIGQMIHTIGTNHGNGLCIKC